MIFHSGYALLPNHFFRRRTLKSVNHVITQSVNHVGLDTKAAPTAHEFAVCVITKRPPVGAPCGRPPDLRCNIVPFQRLAALASLCDAGRPKAAPTAQLFAGAPFLSF